jgi:Tripartite tricarboxylate transporter TctB family
VGAKSPTVSRVGWGEWRHAVVILVVCAVAALALERLGFRITIAAAVGFLLGVVERRGAIFSVVFAVAFAGGTFLLFDTLLRVPLPRGPFGL